MRKSPVEHIFEAYKKLPTASFVSFMEQGEQLLLEQENLEKQESYINGRDQGRADILKEIR